MISNSPGLPLSSINAVVGCFVAVGIDVVLGGNAETEVIAQNTDAEIKFWI